MNKAFDALVVGAGPAGSTAAMRLAARGHRVGLLEEHAQIGSPVNCSGVIGVEAFDRFSLPEALVRHTLAAVEFFSPRSLRWRFDADRPLAHVVVRGELDKLLAKRAEEAGCEVLVDHRVTAVKPVFGGIQVTVGNSQRGAEAAETRREAVALAPRTLSCRSLVIATGAGVPLLKTLDFHDVPQRLLGVQTELELPAREVEVYLGRRWAPEGFAWVIPIGPRRSKVGLLCRRDGPQTLRRFLARPDLRGRIQGEVGPILCSMLPLGFLPRSYAERIVVVGEAAGHIKPTTCGGIYYGMLTAELAAEVLDEGLRSDRLDANMMSLYERRWRDLLQDEIENGLRLRRSFKHMSDWGIERLMSLAQRDGILRLIREKADFDWHRDLIHAVFRHATVGRILGAA